jgi:hypothetical protein
VRAIGPDAIEMYRASASELYVQRIVLLPT